jgi:hypothetical protein
MFAAWQIVATTYTLAASVQSAADDAKAIGLAATATGNHNEVAIATLAATLASEKDRVIAQGSEIVSLRKALDVANDQLRILRDSIPSGAPGSAQRRAK